LEEYRVMVLRHNCVKYYSVFLDEMYRQDLWKPY
jgi:hypothetical protein